MLKQIVVFLLLTALLAQTLSSAAIVVSYYTNTSSYAANCENKARPMLHCNGKCQMLKKLKQDANKEKQNPERKAERKMTVLSSRSFFAVVRNPYIINAPGYSIEPIEAVRDIAGEFFHPPSA